MPFVPVPNTAQANIRYQLDGERIENTLHFTKGSGWAAGDLALLADGLADRWGAFVMPQLSVDCLLREVYVVDLTTATSGTATQAVIPNIPGGNGGESMPNNVAYCVSLRSTNRGRAFRGRIYIPGIPQGVVENSRVTLAWQNAIVAAVESVRGGMLGDGYTMTIASKFSNGLPRPVGLPTPVIAVTAVDNVLDSQRRRLPGRGQ